MRKTHLLLLAALALATMGSKLDRLSEGEYAHYRALRVFMEDTERKEWLKLKTSEERDAWLKDHKLWDRFYSHPEDVRQAIVNGDVEIGWSRDMVYMAWGAPFQKQRLTGRPAARSELLVYRFDIFKDGTATPLVGNKPDYKAVNHHQTELVLDDDWVTEMVEKEEFELIRVEHARALDALPTLALHRQILAEDRFFVTRPDEFGRTLDQREREIAVLEGAPNSCFLVARVPKIRVAGFLTVNGGGLARTRHVGRVELMVAADCRRQGIGRALLDAAIRWATENDVVRKLSLSVLADNDGAIALYRVCGFVEEGRRLREYRESEGSWRDDLLMARPIGT